MYIILVCHWQTSAFARETFVHVNHVQHEFLTCAWNSKSVQLACIFILFLTIHRHFGASASVFRKMIKIIKKLYALRYPAFVRFKFQEKCFMFTKSCHVTIEYIALGYLYFVDNKGTFTSIYKTHSLVLIIIYFIKNHIICFNLENVQNCIYYIYMFFFPKRSY